MAAPHPTCYLDGEYLPLAEARVSPLDRGFLFADGVYEVVPVHRGRPFRLEAHLRRLARSCAAIELANPHDAAGWAGIVARLATAAGSAEQLIYLQLTRGAEASRNHLIPSGIAPTVFAFSSPYPLPGSELLERGLAAACLEDTRWARCDIKSTALLANVLLRQRARELGADEALLLRDGQLVEGSSSSVFVVKDGIAATPPDGPQLLPGTTRDAVIEIAGGLLRFKSRPVPVAELRAADELWIASAGRGVLPVTRLDGAPVGSGVPGPLWVELQARWQRHLDAIATTPALAL